MLKMRLERRLYILCTLINAEGYKKGVLKILRIEVNFFFMGKRFNISISSFNLRIPI